MKRASSPLERFQRALTLAGGVGLWPSLRAERRAAGQETWSWARLGHQALLAPGAPGEAQALGWAEAWVPQR